MEEALIKSLEHAPALLAIIVILYMVGKHLEKRDESAAARTHEFLGTLQEMHADNVGEREKSRLVIERNTVEATNNTNAVREMTEAVKELLRK